MKRAQHTLHCEPESQCRVCCRLWAGRCAFDSQQVQEIFSSPNRRRFWGPTSPYSMGSAIGACSSPLTCTCYPVYRGWQWVELYLYSPCTPSSTAQGNFTHLHTLLQGYPNRGHICKL